MVETRENSIEMIFVLYWRLSTGYARTSERRHNYSCLLFAANDAVVPPMFPLVCCQQIRASSVRSFRNNLARSTSGTVSLKLRSSRRGNWLSASAAIQLLVPLTYFRSTPYSLSTGASASHDLCWIAYELYLDGRYVLWPGVQVGYCGSPLEFPR